jgi:hypothetical protein
MRYYAQHIGSGVWGIWDSGVMSFIANDLSEQEAKQRAADRNVVFDQYGQRKESERRQVSPPIKVESATWGPEGELDYWVKDVHGWTGRVRRPDGEYVWIKAADLRAMKDE